MSKKNPSDDIVLWQEETELSWSLTEKILFAAAEGNEIQAMELVEQFITCEKGFSLGDELATWHFFLVKMAVLMVHMAKERGITPQYAIHLEKTYIQEISCVCTLDESYQLFRDMVKKFCTIGQTHTEGHSPLVQQIIAAVQMDLQMPLTLQYFARRLNVNGSYLSNLFRKETGVTITDYVTSKRVAHAANQLRYTKEPIKTIARMSGIPDVQYFGRVFKKKTGMTPSEYRAKVTAASFEGEVL